MPKKMKERIMKILKKMEEDNKKAFGDGRLDCCDLNRNNNKKK